MADVGISASPLGTYFPYVVICGVTFSVIIGLATVGAALRNSTWSLADALSEEADISPLNKDGGPIQGSDGKPLVISELRASSSRLIALMGLIGILTLYLGFGLVILGNFAISGVLPSYDQLRIIIYILFSGVTMFAPYIVNKFSSIFDWLKPTK